MNAKYTNNHTATKTNENPRKQCLTNRLCTYFGLYPPSTPTDPSQLLLTIVSIHGAPPRGRDTRTKSRVRLYLAGLRFPVLIRVQHPIFDISRNFDWAHPRKVPATSFGGRGKVNKPRLSLRDDTRTQRGIYTMGRSYNGIQQPTKHLKHETQHICARRYEDSASKFLLCKTQNPRKKAVFGSRCYAYGLKSWRKSPA